MRRRLLTGDRQLMAPMRPQSIDLDFVRIGTDLLTRKIVARKYYDLNPALSHSAGDLWRHLPTNGLLGTHSVTGLVITPACDLSNRKVETVTYVPVIPVAEYLSTIAFIPDVTSELKRLCNVLSLTSIAQQNRYDIPSDESIAALSDAVRSASAGSSGKHVDALRKLSAGLAALQIIKTPERDATIIDHVKTLYGKKGWDDLAGHIVTNAHRSDIHFLPADGVPIEWSAVPAHAVAMLRYPFTIPVDVLDAAQDIQISEWRTTLDHIARVTPGASQFSVRPLKVATMQPRFLADLMTRYVALNIRLGSPDFTPETARTLASEIGGTDGISRG